MFRAALQMPLSAGAKARHKVFSNLFILFIGRVFKGFTFWKGETFLTNGESGIPLAQLTS